MIDLEVAGIELTNSNDGEALGVQARAGSLRARILDHAEKQLREYGYAKSTMADIAASLGMSVGNIYRCFASKQELNEALAERMLVGIRSIAQEVADDRSLSAEDRLRRMARVFYENNRECFTGDQRVFEIVVVAISECWRPVRIHQVEMDKMIAGVIAEGVAAEAFFVSDPLAAAQCVRQVVANFADPILMTRQAANLPPSLEQLLDFIIAGLKSLG